MDTHSGQINPEYEEVYLGFGATYCLHLHGIRLSRREREREKKQAQIQKSEARDRVTSHRISGTSKLDQFQNL
jgi:hypothetical protein